MLQSMSAGAYACTSAEVQVKARSDVGKAQRSDPARPYLAEELLSKGREELGLLDADVDDPLGDGDGAPDRVLVLPAERADHREEERDRDGLVLHHQKAAQRVHKGLDRTRRGARACLFACRGLGLGLESECGGVRSGEVVGVEVGLRRWLHVQVGMSSSLDINVRGGPG